jgi:hypothetical protein
MWNNVFKKGYCQNKHMSTSPWATTYSKNGLLHMYYCPPNDVGVKVNVGQVCTYRNTLQRGH